MTWIDIINILCLLHTGDKTQKEHCHFTITLASELQKQSVDKRIKQTFGVKGADYSSKPWDGTTTANAYMFHDFNGTIAINKGYSEDDLVLFRTQNEMVRKVVEINKSRGPGRIVEQVVRDLSGAVPDKGDIGKILLMKIRDGEMYEPGNYKLASLIEEIFLKLVPNEWWDDYCIARISSLKI